MKCLLILIVAIEIALDVNCLPLPAGHVVKYRVPNKFFGQPAAAQGTSDPLYNLLSQIHFGEMLESQTVTLDSVQSEDVSSPDVLVTSGLETATTESSTNEAPEVSKDVTKSEHQQMDIVKPNSDLHTLIEKVVNDEIKKLATTTVTSEAIKLISVSLLNSEAAVTDTVTTTESEPESTSVLSNLDSETILPTDVPAVETMKAETMSSETTERLPNEENPMKISEGVDTTTNRLIPDENVIAENNISDSLLSAVSDLLSSILGLEGSLLKTNPDGSLPVDESLNRMQTISTSNEIADGSSLLKEVVAASTDIAAEPLTTTVLDASSDAPEIEQGTEKWFETTPVGYEGEQSSEEELAEKEIVPLKISSTALNAFKDKVVSEIDLKIENLASSQTSLTESTPEQVTVRDESVNILEVISEPSSYEDGRPVSFDDSVSQVMNLVKAAEDRPALGDSFFLDKNMKDDVIDLDEVVYGTLKEIETSLGIQHGDVEKDELTHEIVDLKAEDIPDFLSIELDSKETPKKNELMKELEENLLLSNQENSKSNEIPENLFMTELEKSSTGLNQMKREPEAEKRGDLIKTLLSELNESLLKEHQTDHFVPNSAKAALHYKQADMDEDF